MTNPDIWKLNKPFDIVRVAVEHYLSDITAANHNIHTTINKPSEIEREYRLEYWKEDWKGAGSAYLGHVQVRKLGVSRTELRIELPFNPQDNMTPALLNLAEEIKSRLIEGLKSDEVFEPVEITVRTNHTFVDAGRLRELHSINPTSFDLSKLIELCEELNKCYANDCFLAVAMLGRAILDHVPPIFGYKNFAEVANNYSAGSKSFRQSMANLENSSRKIADAHLHTQIRQKEILPNRTQVNFSNDLDVLLAEIVRMLK